MTTFDDTETEHDSQPVPPIHREIAVATSVETAFALFTAHIGAWWPLARHSIYGERGVVAFEGGLLVERSGDDSSIWAEVVAWEPPTRLRLTWHPGRPTEEATDLEIGFSPLDDGTLVSLRHWGWERTTEPGATARSYAEGWPLVLGQYGAKMAGVLDGPFAPVDVEQTPAAQAVEGGSWYALVHTPGPELTGDESIFEHPAFAEHLAFLERLRERGLLVAAGPVAPDRGEGMTVIRVLPEHGDLDVEALATTEDQSVATGHLQVEVRPWSVRLTG
jgi:uncharacterized protein YndB with AHSA1/START domain/uncharacterized protein YciI